MAFMAAIANLVRVIVITVVSVLLLPQYATQPVLALGEERGKCQEEEVGKERLKYLRHEFHSPPGASGYDNFDISVYVEQHECKKIKTRDADPGTCKLDPPPDPCEPSRDAEYKFVWEVVPRTLPLPQGQTWLAKPSINWVNMVDGSGTLFLCPPPWQSTRSWWNWDSQARVLFGDVFRGGSGVVGGGDEVDARLYQYLVNHWFDYEDAGAAVRAKALCSPTDGSRLKVIIYTGDGAGRSQDKVWENDDYQLRSAVLAAAGGANVTTALSMDANPKSTLTGGGLPGMRTYFWLNGDLGAPPFQRNGAVCRGSGSRQVCANWVIVPRSMQWNYGDGASHPITWPEGALGVPYPQAQPDGEAGPPHPAAIWAVFDAESGATPYTVTATIRWEIAWGYQEDVTVTPGGIPVQTTLWLYREPGPTVSYTLSYPVTAVPSLLRPPPSTP
ncbi:MAG: hypothetical protein IT340_22175 [Chloroflexi bacterium]|nr:hypothetical protein [Chloroflexota bacterium]